ncbi:hypothetical protein [Nocardioides sp. AE5]|uniref:hypothetical protein n=1 Tax=Nocardioides sp. AE5 TaxID=2962573 RepID=UPI0028822C4E|nr:hypothetical protein [Nocardioides sp. AE5]MDT0203432.1 hypothetical protein [Nocardioides sp. AE5]
MKKDAVSAATWEFQHAEKARTLSIESATATWTTVMPQTKTCRIPGAKRPALATRSSAASERCAATSRRREPGAAALFTAAQAMINCQTASALKTTLRIERCRL